MIQTTLYSIQSLALQLSSLTTKFPALNLSIIPTSNTIDQLINSGLHIPEVFLDEQDRLEAAVQEMESGEKIKFYLALMDQYKDSDEIWFDQRTLEAEIDRLRRDADFQISSMQLSIDSFNPIISKIDLILSQQSTWKAWIEWNSRVLAPWSKFFLDQSELNQSIILNLCLGSDWAQSSLDGLTEGVRVYKLAINILESIKEKWKIKATILEKSANQLRELPDDYCNELEEEEEEEEEEEKEVTIEMKMAENNMVEIGRMLQNSLLEALQMSYQQEEIDQTSLETLFSGVLENRYIEDENKAVELILWMNESENFDSKAWKESLKNRTPTAIHPYGSSNSSSLLLLSLPLSFCNLEGVEKLCTLKDLKRELNDLEDSDHSTRMELIMECWQGLRKRQDTVVVLKSIVEFSKLILECDLSFSRLLNKLEELFVGKRDEGVGKAQIRAFKVLNCQWEASRVIIQTDSKPTISVYSFSGLNSRSLIDFENSSISRMNMPPPSKSSRWSSRLDLEQNSETRVSTKRETIGIPGDCVKLLVQPVSWSF
ncbi:hypothetical protein PPACK8108_LOCUS5711 [Phakopsora pachyrhizi]|uniref:Uncharacterized protein n=1 Tax=Phakopsora pachyrhizi TaxID=170000 RepID=A0AAV0APH1_PHAPC|nr:hypothetical protein PPACK8108_LOCUS5711 [Phakopsora pachyrhizi]